MRLKNLILENIGPFKKAELEFISEQESENPPVICITGENGTGKSIILDAIRGLIMGRFSSIEREIVASEPFLVHSDITVNGRNKSLKSHSLYNGLGQKNIAFDTNDMEFNTLFKAQFEPPYKRNFILDYWTSKLSNDKFDITSIAAIDTKTYLDDALTGIHRNIDLIKIITFFDYLKDSVNREEKELGTALYGLLENIVNLSLAHGELSHVSRISLNPIVKIGDSELSLAKLSSGNLYLIQRLANLLRQVYSICVTNNISISDYKTIKGLLLIDEAENHLHPKWQKVFLQNILELFPKLQIIVSTHSPFIISSIQNSRVYVCKDRINYSIVEEETDYYVNKPIEEILLSPLFDTSNFSNEISMLLKDRKKAIVGKDKKKASDIEKKLLELNPEYFNYLNIDSVIKSIKK